MKPNGFSGSPDRIEFTESEIKEIKSLPIRKVKFAGQERHALYNEKERILYLLDSKGIPTGELLRLGKNLNPKSDPNLIDRAKGTIKTAMEDFSAASSTDDAGGKDGKQKIKEFVGKVANKTIAQADSKSTEEKEAKSKWSIKRKRKISDRKTGGSENGDSNIPDGKPKTRKARVIGVILAIALTLSFIGGIALGNGIGTSRSLDKPVTQAGKDAADQKIEAIQVNKDMIPGDIITENDLEIVLISGELYNQVGLTGDSVYTADKVPYLVGMYINQYVPSGQFLTHKDTVGVYSPASNPFLTLNDGYAYLDIPVSLGYEYIASVMIGRAVDITLKVNTLISSPESVDTDEVPGLDHSTTITEQTITDIYRLQNINILDMTAADGSSLYTTLSELNAIPDGDLMKYLTNMVAEKSAELKKEGIVDEQYYGISRLYRQCGVFSERQPVLRKGHGCSQSDLLRRNNG